MITCSTNEKTETQEDKDLTQLSTRTTVQSKMSESLALHHYANVLFTLGYNTIFQSGNLNLISCSTYYMTSNNIYILPGSIFSKKAFQ